jgi:hypothetical protein
MTQMKAQPQLRSYSLASQHGGLNSISEAHVESAVDELAIRQVSSGLFNFPVSIIPSMLYIHLFIYH